MQINIKVFYKLILLHLMGAARHFQSTQNSMYAISLQYLKPQISDEVNFLHVDKHQSFLKVDTIFFHGLGEICANYPDNVAISLR